jgi:hypothetical protein
VPSLTLDWSLRWRHTGIGAASQWGSRPAGPGNGITGTVKDSFGSWRLIVFREKPRFLFPPKPGQGEYCVFASLIR